MLLLEVAALVLALWNSGLSQNVAIGALFGAFGVLIAGAALLDHGSVADGTIWVVNVALVLAIAVVVVIGIADQQEINRQSVTGAICVYILIGLLFALVYGAAAAFGSGSFFAQGTDGTTSLRLYFSYVTLATLGYGDYTPAGDFGHTAAISEALIGRLLPGHRGRDTRCRLGGFGAPPRRNRREHPSRSLRPRECSGISPSGTTRSLLVAGTRAAFRARSSVLGEGARVQP